MATEVEIRKWGNSMGIILPRELISSKDLKQHDKILIDVVRRADLTKLFRSFRTGKTGQQFKDMVRKGWQNLKNTSSIPMLSVSCSKAILVISLIQRTLQSLPQN